LFVGFEGRAGRPQFGERSAVAVIMTKLEHKQKYENLLLGRQKIESKYKNVFLF
jgi:replicative superfamily II helicase